MGLSAATLKTGLKNMTPTLSEVTAINSFAAAWKTYFSAAMAGPIPIASAALLDPAITAMKAALIGMSGPVPGGAVKLQLGIIAFWGAVVPSAATIWISVPPALSAVPPAGLSGISVALTAAFTANKAGNLSLDAACQAIATAIHATQSGGQVIFPTPESGGIGPQTIS